MYKEITVAGDPPISDNDLARDGVHLNKLPLERFKQYVWDQISSGSDDEVSPMDDDLVRSPILSQPTSNEDVNMDELMRNGRVEEMLVKIYALMTEDRQSQKVQKKQIADCEDKVEKVAEQSEKLSIKFSSLQISTARMKEELDSISNAQRRNILVVRKLEKESNVQLPTDMKNKGILIKRLFTEKISSLPMANQKDFMIKSIFVLKTPENPSCYQDFRVFLFKFCWCN